MSIQAFVSELIKEKGWTCWGYMSYMRNRHLLASTDTILELSDLRTFQKFLWSALYLKFSIYSYPFYKADQIGCFKISMLNLFSFTKYLTVSHFPTYSASWNIFFKTNFPSWLFLFFKFCIFYSSGRISFSVNRRQKGASW